MRRVKHVMPGDYVLCCKYTDRDKHDHWQVGFIDRMTNFGYHKNVFILRGKTMAYFKCCFLITPFEGEKIIKTGDPRSVRLSRSPVRAYCKPGRK